MSARDIAVEAARTALVRMDRVHPKEREMILTRVIDNVMTLAEEDERDECAVLAGEWSTAAAEAIRARGPK